MINVCTTVFNRYELLARQFRSIAANPFTLDNPASVSVFLIDQGQRPDLVVEAREALGASIPLTVLNPGSQCLAAAWNCFIRNVPDNRLTVGEDVHFGPKAFFNVEFSDAGCLGLEDGVSAQFSAFVLRDTVVDQIGFFDEEISPEYVYYEDIDYKYRMKCEGLTVKPWYDVLHSHEQDNKGTLGVKSPEQVADHHRRFVIAQHNYIKKWGGLPGRETRIP